jgi:hypothetical protein
MKNKKKKKFDAFSYHEVLDRAYCIANMMEDMLVTHPVVKKHKKIKKSIDKAQRHLLDAYQLIGNKQKP